MIDLPRRDRGAQSMAAFCDVEDALPVGRVVGRDVPADQIWIRAGALLVSGQRLVLVAAHRDRRDSAGGAWLRLVYVFTSGPPGQCTELHVRMRPGRSLVPTLAGLSAPAAVFEADISRRHGVVFTDPPQPGPSTTDLSMTAGWRNGRRLPQVRPGHLEAYRRDPAVLAERISVATDSPVGHTLAYCLAVEEALGQPVTGDVARGRAVLLELERLHRHLTDLGIVARLADQSPLYARMLHLRERLLCLNDAAAGHRLLRGSVMLGGVAPLCGIDLDELRILAHRLADFTADALSNARLRARLNGLGVLPTADARDLGVLGFIARASGVDTDARRTHPFIPLDLRPEWVNDQGDALARFCVRAQEMLTSATLVAQLARTFTAASTSGWRMPATSAATAGVGIVEGWRGAIVCRVELDSTGAVTRLVTVDPSYLHAAVANAIGGSVCGRDATLAHRSLHTLTEGPQL